MKTAIFLFLIILLAGIVSAEPPCAQDGFMGRTSVNAPIILTQTCPTCTFINITIRSPTTQPLVTNVPMTLTGGTYFYTVNSTNTSEIGTYFVDGYSNLDDPFVGCFEISLTGFEFDNLWMNFLIIFLLTGGSFSLIYIFNESRSSIQGKDGNFIYYYLGAFMLFSIGVMTIISGFGGYQTLLTQAVGYIVWGSGLFFMTKPYFTGGKWKW